MFFQRGLEKKLFLPTYFSVTLHLLFRGRLLNYAFGISKYYFVFILQLNLFCEKFIYISLVLREINLPSMLCASIKIM